MEIGPLAQNKLIFIGTSNTLVILDTSPHHQPLTALTRAGQSPSALNTRMHSFLCSFSDHSSCLFYISNSCCHSGGICPCRWRKGNTVSAAGLGAWQTPSLSLTWGYRQWSIPFHGVKRFRRNGWWKTLFLHLDLPRGWCHWSSALNAVFSHFGSPVNRVQFPVLVLHVLLLSLKFH